MIILILKNNVVNKDMTMIIKATKQKEETYGLIAKYWDRTMVGREFTIVQANDRGGKSLQKTLETEFDVVTADMRDKSRYITITKTESEPDCLIEWRKYALIRYVRDIDFYSMPGIFGWNKIDMGSRLLTSFMSDIKGRVADFGCGYGYLSRYIVKNYKDFDALYCIDNDDRAVECCKRNVKAENVTFMVADCTQPMPNLPNLDYVVMNPPFHDKEKEDREIGQKFIQTAHHHLETGGVCWMVANKHLPYEEILKECFSQTQRIVERDGFKIFKSVK